VKGRGDREKGEWGGRSTINTKVFFRPLVSRIGCGNGEGKYCARKKECRRAERRGVRFAYGRGGVGVYNKVQPPPFFSFLLVGPGFFLLI